MQTVNGSILVALIATNVLSASVSAAPVPTFSLEAASINDVPIAQGPSASIEVLPGDRLTLEVYIRDWSPAGQQLIACQAQINPASFSSGEKGFIEPFGYNAARLAGTDNPTQCFIDLTHPKYIYLNKTTIPVTDTRSEGYRWLSALIDMNSGPLSKQDGTKFYMGSVNMLVSGNAQGKFDLSLIDSNDSCQILESSGAQIMPMKVESLQVSIGKASQAGALRRLIDLANRPTGSIDLLPGSGSVTNLLADNPK